MIELFYPEETAPRIPGPKAADVGSALNGDTAGEVYYPVVLENGIVIGRSSRSYCHNNALLHPAIHLYIIDRNGDIYLHRRASSKNLYPLRWDSAAGGHVCYGETFVETLYRKADEVLNYSKFNPTNLGTFVYEADGDRELVSIFACIGHPEIHPNFKEESEGRWWTQEEISDNLGKDIFTPDFESEFKEIRSALNALL